MRRVVAGLAALPLLLPGATPAHAASGSVTVSYAAHYTQVGGGYLVEAVCEATADPKTSGDVALLTTVMCEVNGGGESRTMPGSKAFSHMTAAALMPIVVCYSASATFFDPDSVPYDASLARTCVQIAPRT